jgi:hypothetical protein
VADADRWTLVERIYQEAVDRPLAERARFLDSACLGDHVLRREVESLLARDGPSLLDRSGFDAAAREMAQDVTPSGIGRTIGSYEILGLLGTGGMGEVYRARDTSLGRDVAVKLLPHEMSGDSARLKRLAREARMLASLNHPRIATLHGLEEHDGQCFLVMELVPGSTLAERLRHGALPVREALDVGRQIAEGLEAAHEAGIIHRDLKPANVKVLPDGRVKVLDFGLAKAPETSGPGAQPTDPGSDSTFEGTILGTPAYMSPEQARGQTVDRRADIWAFGCVLYELLTGRAAFLRSTVTDTLAAVLQQQPDWTALPATLPPAVTTLLRRCLDKDVRRRRRDIGDVRAELDDALAQPDTAPAQPIGDIARPATRTAPRALLALAGVALAALAALTGQWMFAPPASTASEARFKRLTDAVGIEEMPAVSPDGKDLAFVARVDGRRQIWIRRLTGGHPLQITFDDVDHEHPRWTHDSSAIVYFTPPLKEDEAGALWEIPALNGAPRRVAASITGADVSHDGRWLATFQKSGDRIDLAILSRDGATSGQLIPVDVDAIEFNPPRWSPDDRSLAFYLGESAWTYHLFVTDVAKRKMTRLKAMTNIKGIAWLPDGDNLVFASSVGSEMMYRPVFNLRLMSRDGAGSGNSRLATCPTSSPISSQQANSMRRERSCDRISGGFQLGGHLQTTSGTAHRSHGRPVKCRRRRWVPMTRRSRISPTAAGTRMSGSRE